VAWESHVSTLPANEHVAPGTYYLKANHGSDMFERVNFPISNTQRQALEVKAHGWLKSKFGFNHGEWWYNAFEPKIFLEHSITGNEDSISWNFYVINGRIPLISLFLKRAD